MRSASLRRIPSGWKSIKRELSGNENDRHILLLCLGNRTICGIDTSISRQPLPYPAGKNDSLRSVIDFLALVEGLGGQLQAQLFKDIDVHAGEHDRGVNLAAPQLGKLL